MKKYQHQQIDGTPIALPNGKVLCVGRNYAEHAKELGNPLPKAPLLFIKPITSLCHFSPQVEIPKDRGTCHFETEISVLLKKELKNVTAEMVDDAIWGYGVGLDLTLRDLQNELKKQGHPWEIAKAFDDACPLTFFLPKEFFSGANIVVESYLNDRLAQRAVSSEMIWSINDLIVTMSKHFTLQAGDVILTGTPAGVAELKAGDKMQVCFPASQFKNQKESYFSETRIV